MDGNREFTPCVMRVPELRQVLEAVSWVIVLWLGTQFIAPNTAGLRTQKYLFKRVKTENFFSLNDCAIRRKT